MSNGEWDTPRKVEAASWLVQTAFMIVMAVAGYFINTTLQNINEEMQLSRIERAQLRADLSAFQLGVTGNRYTRTDADKAHQELEQDMREIRERLRQIEINR